jgi:hypothetical protein
MIRYGRMDVRFLIPLYHILVKRLWERGVSAAVAAETTTAAALRNLSFVESSLETESSMEIDMKEKSQPLPSNLENSSLQSISTDLDLSPLPPRRALPSSSRALDGSLSCFSFSFSEQQSLSPIPSSTPTPTLPSPATARAVVRGDPTDAIDQIFSLTLSNSRELWSPTIPDLNDKKSLVKISTLKNKYEAFRRKSKSKTWQDQNTHLFMR